MAVCFVSNKHLTIPYSDLARRMARAGERIVWLSPSTRWTRWLESEGWDRNDILDLPDHAADWTGADGGPGALADLEVTSYPTIANVILMCRGLRAKTRGLAYGYLAACRARIEPFLRERGVEAVFGEGTWGFELLTWLVCRRLGIPMTTPCTTRIPDDRFLFVDALTGRLPPFAPAAQADRDWATGFLDQWLRRPVAPAYAASQRRYVAFHRRWLEELRIGILSPELDRHDETLWPLRRRVADRIARAWNARRYGIAKPSGPAPAATPYVLYCLHRQPEAPVDVYGALHSDQRALIERLTRMLPATHELWVKEHPAALGDRPVSWYRDVERLPNVRLVDPFLPIHDMIRGAAAVVTISGTVGYEAALLDVPVLGLAPLYFSELYSAPVDHGSDPLDWPLRRMLTDPATRPTGDRARRIDFLARLHANSFAGNPVRLHSTPEQRAGAGYLEIEADAFLAFCAHVRRNPAAMV